MLRVTGLNKKYGDNSVVQELSLHIPKGESYGLLGPNGAGKSTTISMISGLIKPTSGSIHIADVDMIAYPKSAQQHLGVVPQDIALYLKMTAKENLIFWGRMYGLKGQQLKKRVAEVLEIIGLTDRANDKVETYSGGMKRRVNIGAAILHEPQLLIMDEPTVGIDPQSRNHILETVKELNKQGMTIIYTSHYMEEVEFLCTRIGIMDQGKLLVQGNIQELQQLVGHASSLHIQLSKDPDDITQLLHRLSLLDENNTFTYNNNLLMTVTEQPQALLSQVLPVLIDQKITTTSIEIVQPNLEAVFLHLTGRSLRD